MTLMEKILNTLSSQIKGTDVKLPFKELKSPKIQDNNQAISNGAINEELNSSLRSKSPTWQGCGRSTQP
jgi:hypothetical protein